MTDIKTSVPKPKTSLKTIPHIPQANPAIIGACQFLILILAGIVPVNRTNFIKSIATIAANGPIIPRLIIISPISKGIAVSRSGGLTIPISVAEKLAAIDEIASAATAFIEKCLKTVSWAKIIPAKGAPNPAEIAAATPLPIIISCGILGINCWRLINDETVAPKWTRGP